jgi:asparagine N-glycosylation enzyme membrane subunit Stt3
MAKRVATILGIVFLLVGVLGFVAPGVGGFHLSTTHNLIHIISGAASLYFGLAGTLRGARLFCLVFGAVYGLLGIAGFLLGAPGTPSMPGMAADDRLFKVLPGALELGTSDHTFHILLAIVYIVAALMTKTDHDGARNHA